jgi:hypothetical protein
MNTHVMIDHIDGHSKFPILIKPIQKDLDLYQWAKVNLDFL